MSETPRDWAESVHVDGVADDGRTGFALRLARYPGSGAAWLWAHVFLPDEIAGYNDDTLPLTGFLGATDVATDAATFALDPPVHARFERRGLVAGPLRGRASVAVRGHRDAHAPVGPGDTPIGVEVEFDAAHEPETARPGRIEVMGTTRARLTLGRRTVELRCRGKWHEQTGARPRFAGAFTYVALRGSALDVLASGNARGAWGFAVEDGRVRAVQALTIDPPGPRRRFTIALEGGAVLSGMATVTHAYSVAVEGDRRPGTLVLAETDRGTLSGVINDWRPA